jgi:hypothetical protein
LSEQYTAALLGRIEQLKKENGDLSSRVAMLEAENKHMVGLLERDVTAMRSRFVVNDDGTWEVVADMEPHWAISAIGMALADHFKESGAKNFFTSEMTFRPSESWPEGVGPLVVIVQRAWGKSVYECLGERDDAIRSLVALADKWAATAIKFTPEEAEIVARCRAIPIVVAKRQEPEGGVS